MKEYPNFYENMKEAHARLLQTIVLYDGLPYQIHAITDHMKDGIFRTWLVPIGISGEGWHLFYNHLSNYSPDNPALGPALDKIYEKEEVKKSGILRKHMNSPKFNRFRPFPLGMCNVGTQVYYVERQPIRPHMFQGLTKGGCSETLITAGSRQDNPKRSLESLNTNSLAFRDCILGDHFSPEEALRALLDPTIAHDALAFNREFAFVRGPLDMMFIAYRSDIIGVLQNNDFSRIRLGRNFQYCKEVVQELNLFANIT